MYPKLSENGKLWFVMDGDNILQVCMTRAKCKEFISMVSVL